MQVLRSGINNFYDGFVENNHNLFEAVEKGNTDSVIKILNEEKLSSKTLIQVLIAAQRKNNNEMVRRMLGETTAYSVDVVNQALAIADEYDENGNHLALELAKRIKEVSFRNEAIAIIGKKITEKTNSNFKQNFYSTLQSIRKNMQFAMDKKSEVSSAKSLSWWSEQPQIHQAVVDTQCNAIEKSMISKNQLNVICAGKQNRCFSSICEKLAKTKQLTVLRENQTVEKGSVDILFAPHTLYNEMESLFKASEDLLHKEHPLDIEKHPLFEYFNMLTKDGVFVATLHSGPNVLDFSDLLLGQHELQTEKANRFDRMKLKIFNNVETFFRCLDIFEKKFEEKTGKSIKCELSFSLSHLPIDAFCKEYIKQYPELITMDLQEREKFIHLLSVFEVNDHIVDLNVTLTMSINETREPKRSFKPINQEHAAAQKESNEISSGQLDLNRQIQNINGSELMMVHTKDADGQEQFKAFKSILGRNHVKLVDIGGGRGETNAIPNAISDAGSTVHLLNVEPNENFVEPYIHAHQTLGIQDVHTLQLFSQQLSAADVIEHFHGEKVDAVFSSHCFYFILGDLFKASQDSTMPLEQHPLWKYFDMLKDDGVFVVSLQSGAGSRLFRNALLGIHGLNPSSDAADLTVELLSSFGNMATFLRHFELFAERFEKQTGKKINLTMHHSVANVPLGNFKVDQDPVTNGYIIHNPNGADSDPSWLAPRMLDFYGNWAELEFFATLTDEKVKSGEPKTIENLKKYKFENPTLENIAEKRESARKKQETFLHILRAVAPAEVNMLHPNITLEITLQQNKDLLKKDFFERKV